MSLRNEDSHKADLRPEYCQYEDTGCEFSETCLNCPLPLCVYDEPGGRQTFLKRHRSLEMTRLHNREGKSIRELAAIYGVSIRTVQRALKSVRENQAEGTTGSYHALPPAGRVKSQAESQKGFDGFPACVGNDKKNGDGVRSCSG